MNITLRLRNIFYLIIAFVTLWFLYVERHILAPFIIAMMFAYVFNPLINFFAHRFRIPRTISILLVYILLIFSAIFTVGLLARSVMGESISIKNNLNSFFVSIRKDVDILPFWLQPYLMDYADYFSKMQFFTTVPPFPLFTRAFSGVLNFFVFLFAAFFFLKDNRRMIDKLLLLAPNEYKVDVAILLRKINTVLASYLRGQLILIVSMIIMLFISFSILGVRFGLTISVLSALFEIVPIIGPIVASILGTFVIVVSGGIQNFELNTIQTIIVILTIYYVSRQIQDYAIAPFVIGKATKLHPLLILFSVLAGEHIYGILGVLLAVPVAATAKIVYEFVLDKIREEDRERQKR